jgi:hypothetical protein
VTTAKRKPQQAIEVRVQFELIKLSLLPFHFRLLVGCSKSYSKTEKTQENVSARWCLRKYFHLKPQSATQQSKHTQRSRLAQVFTG